MSMLMRRSVLRAVPRSTRGFSAAAGEGSYAEKQAALKAHAGETANLWRRISFYVCAPGIFVTALWANKVEKEHAAHEAHIREEHDGHLPEVPPYPYLNVRNRPFPWGMNSLFFNPHVQKDMTQEE
ncbi:mitochondrial cytochrome c oxidase subunit VIa [Irpex rosettiformis]|uniref:Mitochondrial cytochrome c oxidase subunit VIa n=1 Tax=Irpex rosettiformis TaxID=378272 RepID=A0ACB8UL58_9APHY|nr:mitochondrial cytochrome c oxidase subunit VIa [Irpex rosettiformis]